MSAPDGRPSGRFAGARHEGRQIRILFTGMVVLLLLASLTPANGTWVGRPSTAGLSSVGSSAYQELIPNPPSAAAAPLNHPAGDDSSVGSRGSSAVDPSPMGLAAGEDSAVSPATNSISIGPVLYTENLDRYFGAVAEFGPVSPSSSLTTLVDNTTINVLRFGDDMDATNLAAGISYNASGVAVPSLINVVSDWNFCESLTPKCVYIAELPGETNSTADVLSAMNYLHAHGISAAYYEIGNEPEMWSHFDEPWTSWSSSPTSVTTALQYALEVQKMIPVIRSVVPGARIIGLEDDQCSDDAYVKDVASIDGPNISAIGCHSYPASGIDVAGAGLQQVYNTLLPGGANFATNVPSVRSAITSACPRCNIPVWVDEFNIVAGNDPADFSAYMTTYPDFVLTAGDAVLGLTVNLSQSLFFALWPSGGYGNYGMVTSSYAVRPSYDWYSYFAPNITSGQLYSVAYTPTYAPSFATYLQSSTGSLLVVNANATHSETVSVSLPLSLSNGGKTIYWGNTTPAPRVTPYSSLPSTYTLAPASVLLVDVNAAKQGPPAPPQDLVASTHSSSQIDLTWTNPSGTLTENHVYEYGAGCTSLLTTINLAGVFTNFSATNLSDSSAYCFAVTASNSAGESELSDEASATTFDGALAAPVELSATTVSSTEIDLAWTNPSGPLTDSFVFWGSSCGSLTPIDVGAVLATYAKTGLVPSTYYCFEVSVSINGTEGPPSSPATATTSTPPSKGSGTTNTSGTGPASPGPSAGMGEGFDIALQWLSLGFLGPMAGSTGLLALRIAIAGTLGIFLALLVVRRTRGTTVRRSRRVVARPIRVRQSSLPAGYRPPPDAKSAYRAGSR
jgi:hypothetical protein